MAKKQIFLRRYKFIFYLLKNSVYLFYVEIYIFFLSEYIVFSSLNYHKLNEYVMFHRYVLALLIRGVMVIVVENGRCDTSSNPGRD